MENLEQIRAKNAFAARDRIDATAATKLPAMIVNNGLLAAIAFCIKKETELLEAMSETGRHLSDAKIGRIKPVNNCTKMLEQLSAGTAENLQLATSEALAFLSYMKRFAKKGSQE